MIKTVRHILLVGTLTVASVAMATSASAESRRSSPDLFMPVSAQSFMPVERRSKPQWAQRKISASEAKSIAMRKVPGGEVVDISLKGNTYRVRVIRRDGRVVDVFIDAMTGRAR